MQELLQEDRIIASGHKTQECQTLGLSRGIEHPHSGTQVEIMERSKKIETILIPTHYQ